MGDSLNGQLSAVAGVLRFRVHISLSKKEVVTPLESFAHLFGEPVVCTLDSSDFHHFRGFRDFREFSTQLLVCSCLSCLLRFRRFLLISFFFVLS